GVRGGLRGYSGKIRRYLGRKQPKTCVWVSDVEGREFCKGLNPTYATIKTECQSLNHAIQIYLNDFFLTSQP
ncbi:hypothetical protein C7X99_002005, partial [Neisseria gonorrhoeae]